MRIFEINITRIFADLLPTFLRSGKGIRMFLNAVGTPLNYLLSIFQNNRNANLYNLQITPQICYLEKALNDRFDSAGRGIYISNGGTLPQIYLFLYTEQEYIYIYLDSEGNAILPMFQQGENGGFINEISFIIHVPAALNLNFNEVINFINQYKLVGKTCTVAVF